MHHHSYTLSASATASYNAFMKYAAEKGKNYANVAEFNSRMQNFLLLDTEINSWNSNPKKTSEMGHNFMSDLTSEEKKNFAGLKLTPPRKLQSTKFGDLTARASDCDP